jgi:predicted metal-binding membrane protein
VERLGRERLVVVLSLAGVVALAWLWLWRQAVAMEMSGVQMAGMAMSMPAAAPADALGLSLVFFMWVVMMVGMMLPSAAPAILLYGSLARKHAERGRVLPAVWIFAAGYLLAWTAFSFGAALLQAVLRHAALLDAMMSSSSRILNGALLTAAGVYQFTPLKHRCLSKCREPLPFFIAHWREGKAGALRMGMRHGAYCVGCCAMLMLLLFALGVMSLAWVAALAALILVEKLLPAGPLTARAFGAALVVLGVATLLYQAA